MTVTETARAERMSIARYRCEATGLHHRDCPGDITDDNANQFVLHHVIRRGDKHAADYENRDNVVNLRVVFNGGPLGAARCHGLIHSNQTVARANGLLTPQPQAFPDFKRPIPMVTYRGQRIPASTAAHQPGEAA